MIIRRVFSNKPSFKSFTLDSDFNVILADVTNQSSERDSRNGLGKSLLLDIVSFCLGSNLPSKLNKESLSDWTFGLDVSIDGNDYLFERATKGSGKIKVTGDISNWDIEADETQVISVDDFNYALGELVFGIKRDDSSKKFRPKFRGLMSYFMRTDKTAFVSPFKHFSSQAGWNTQVLNAYLLTLNWGFASDLQILKERKDALKSFEQAAQGGVLEEFTGSIGELEAERVKVGVRLSQMEKNLAEFKVHDQYHELQEQANQITASMHKLLNDINMNEQTAKYYADSLQEEKDVSADVVEAIYNEVGVSFPTQLSKTLNEVRLFHETIVENRRSYLDDEIKRLNTFVTTAKQEVEELSVQREALMKTLQSHGALDEYSKMQSIASTEQQKLEEITGRIARLNELADGMSDLNVEIEQLSRAMRQDTQERRDTIDQAISIFNANSEALYSQPGTLSVDVTSAGYKLNVEIERADSDGVENMKVFCYDLTIAELWASKKNMPVTLFHDSRLFDGVDERQVAKALELARQKSKELGFQYICTLNSDIVPHSKFTAEFKEEFETFVKLRLNDKEDGSGTLLGRWV